MSTLTPSILDLANEIQLATETIHAYLQDNSLLPLSFSSDAFPFFPGTGPRSVDPFPKPSGSVQNARRDLRQACETLLQLIMTPADHLIWNFACAHDSSACLQYVYRFRIADAVPVLGDISYADLAKKAGVDQGQCTRILRMIMTQNYFHEAKPGHVGHTAGSKLLQTLKDTVGYVIEETFPSASSIGGTVKRYGASGERNETAWNVAHGKELPIFEYFEQDPIRMTRFLGHMDNLGSNEAYNIEYLTRGYDWKGLGKGTVVDVGGSTGHASFAIARVAPELDFVVQDLKNVTEGAKKRAEDHKNERVVFEVHDFLQPQTITGASVYLLRFICHDYSDKIASKILGNLIPAMASNSKIVIMDGIVPGPHTVTKFEERIMRTMDMEMMLNFNAVERDLESWKALFAKVHRRLRLLQVVTPPGSAQSIMELAMEHH
ncbi:hypothetical protein LTR66_014137 [Elasticomyces elasticus]|nr:hypothetical protein LTR66_014137 [Elasticomyces elasticus]